MRIDSNSNRKLFELTAERISHLNACSAAGQSLSAAAREVGVDPATIKSAARRQGLTQWLRTRFPIRSHYCGGGYNKPKCSGELRRLAPEDLADIPMEVDRSLLHVRAAVMTWRKVA